MILIQADLDLAVTIYSQHFPDAVLVRAEVDEQRDALVIRVVREEFDKSLTLTIQGEHVRAAADPDDFRQLILDSAKEHKFRHALAKVLH